MHKTVGTTEYLKDMELFCVYCRVRTPFLPEKNQKQVQPVENKKRTVHASATTNVSMDFKKKISCCWIFICAHFLKARLAPVLNVPVFSS